MFFLRRRDTPETAGWWLEIERRPHAAPGLVRELMRGTSTVCDPPEARQALAWARAHPAWTEDPAPLYLHGQNRLDRHLSVRHHRARRAIDLGARPTQAVQ